MRTTLNLRSVFSLLGSILKWLGLPLVVPLFLAFYEGTPLIPFVVPLVVTVLLGSALERVDPSPELALKESFLLVSLAWLAVAIVGALPYVLEGRGTVATPVNALFESMSGFTTTGATVMDSISLRTHTSSLMIWRQLTQWLGGMGIIVLGIAILPKMSVGGSELIKAEAPGPEVEKLTPRIVETARRLWILYALLTLALFLLLYGSHLLNQSPDMGLYNSVAHALTTLPTGGFSPAARSIEAYSPTVQWIIVPFMFLAGTNFALQWRAFSGRPVVLFRDREFRTYLFAVLFFSLFLGALLYGARTFGNTLETARHSLFQVLTIVTTTGFASHDFNTWNQMSKTILFLLMFLGGCAGSTSGGIKIMRWMTSLKSVLREFTRTAYPRVVDQVRVGSKIIDDQTLRRISSMIILYFFTFFVGVLFVELEAYRVGAQLRPIESMTTVAACLGNIGPGLGLVGPMNNYLSFTIPTKLILTVLMWAGRLELFTLFLLLLPRYWKI